ncbi:MAG: hypothetical protein WEB60_05560 [Terrimicrobiaceae bacterium]
MLINSHGYIDHVGNNDVIHELQAEEVEHYCPAKDYPNLCDQAGFFSETNYGADEFIGAIPSWGDSDPENQLSACRLVIDLLESGAVAHAARGHHWGIVDLICFSRTMAAARLKWTSDQTSNHGPFLRVCLPATLSVRL